jgi:hypothetical protein
MFAFTLLVQKRVSEAQKRVDNARLFDSGCETMCSTLKYSSSSTQKGNGGG